MCVPFFQVNFVRERGQFACLHGLHDELGTLHEWLLFQVILVKWNEPYQKLASCDSSGIIFVWIKYEGRWSIELINDRNTPVTHFSWSHDGRMALICYQASRAAYVIIQEMSVRTFMLQNFEMKMYSWLMMMVLFPSCRMVLCWLVLWQDSDIGLPCLHWTPQSRVEYGHLMTNK